MVISFVTGNEYKLKEIKELLAPFEVRQVNIDLHELQTMDMHKIIEHKLTEGLKHAPGNVIVEDSSFHMSCLKGLPGPNIRWFMETLGNDGMHNLADKLGDTAAEAVTIIGYAKSPSDLNYFEGSIKGKIIKPRGNSRFGWEPIFLPDGFNKTFGEMSREEKHAISMRAIAARKLKEFLEKTNKSRRSYKTKTNLTSKRA